MVIIAFSSLTHHVMEVDCAPGHQRTHEMMITEPLIGNGFILTSYERHAVVNHQQLECLFNLFFRLTPKETLKPALRARCDGKPPMTDGFTSQRASNAENVAISWRYHVIAQCESTALLQTSIILKMAPVALETRLVLCNSLFIKFYIPAVDIEIKNDKICGSCVFFNIGSAARFRFLQISSTM